MDLVQFSLERLVEPSWNANRMDHAGLTRLKRSIQRYGLVVPLVVRPVGYGNYLTMGGAQRLQVSGESGCTPLPA